MQYVCRMLVLTYSIKERVNIQYVQYACCCYLGLQERVMTRAVRLHVSLACVQYACMLLSSASLDLGLKERGKTLVTCLSRLDAQERVMTRAVGLSCCHD